MLNKPTLKKRRNVIVHHRAFLSKVYLATEKKIRQIQFAFRGEVTPAKYIVKIYNNINYKEYDFSNKDVEYIAEMAAKIKFRDKTFRNSCHYAALYFHIEKMRFICSFIDEYLPCDRFEILNSINKNDFTPIEDMLTSKYINTKKKEDKVALLDLMILSGAWLWGVEKEEKLWQSLLATKHRQRALKKVIELADEHAKFAGEYAKCMFGFKKKELPANAKKILLNMYVKNWHALYRSTCNDNDISLSMCFLKILSLSVNIEDSMLPYNDANAKDFIAKYELAMQEVKLPSVCEQIDTVGLTDDKKKTIQKRQDSIIKLEKDRAKKFHKMVCLLKEKVYKIFSLYKSRENLYYTKEYGLKKFIEILFTEKFWRVEQKAFIRDGDILFLVIVVPGELAFSVVCSCKQEQAVRNLLSKGYGNNKGAQKIIKKTFPIGNMVLLPKGCKLQEENLIEAYLLYTNNIIRKSLDILFHFFQTQSKGLLSSENIKQLCLMEKMIKTCFSYSSVFNGESKYEMPLIKINLFVIAVICKRCDYKCQNSSQEKENLISRWLSQSLYFKSNQSIYNDYIINNFHKFITIKLKKVRGEISSYFKSCTFEDFLIYLKRKQLAKIQNNLFYYLFSSNRGEEKSILGCFIPARNKVSGCLYMTKNKYHKLINDESFMSMLSRAKIELFLYNEKFYSNLNLRDYSLLFRRRYYSMTKHVLNTGRISGSENKICIMGFLLQHLSNKRYVQNFQQYKPYSAISAEYLLSGNCRFDAFKKFMRYGVSVFNLGGKSYINYTEKGMKEYITYIITQYAVEVARNRASYSFVNELFELKLIVIQHLYMYYYSPINYTQNIIKNNGGYVYKIGKDEDCYVPVNYSGHHPGALSLFERLLESDDIYAYYLINSNKNIIPYLIPYGKTINDLIMFAYKRKRYRSVIGLIKYGVLMFPNNQMMHLCGFILNNNLAMAQRIINNSIDLAEISGMSSIFKLVFKYAKNDEAISKGMIELISAFCANKDSKLREIEEIKDINKTDLGLRRKFISVKKRKKYYIRKKEDKQQNNLAELYDEVELESNDYKLPTMEECAEYIARKQREKKNTPKILNKENAVNFKEKAVSFAEIIFYFMKNNRAKRSEKILLEWVASKKTSKVDILRNLKGLEKFCDKKLLSTKVLSILAKFKITVELFDASLKYIIKTRKNNDIAKDYIDARLQSLKSSELRIYILFTRFVEKFKFVVLSVKDIELIRSVEKQIAIGQNAEFQKLWSLIKHNNVNSRAQTLINLFDILKLYFATVASNYRQVAEMTGSKPKIILGRKQLTDYIPCVYVFDYPLKDVKITKVYLDVLTKLLLSGELSPYHAINKWGDTILHCVFKYQEFFEYILLFRKINKKDLSIEEACMDRVNKEGFTPVDCAFIFNNQKILDNIDSTKHFITKNAFSHFLVITKGLNNTVKWEKYFTKNHPIFVLETAAGENILHLALKLNEVDFIAFMQTKLPMQFKELLSKKDKSGISPLQLVNKHSKFFDRGLSAVILGKSKKDAIKKDRVKEVNLDILKNIDSLLKSQLEELIMEHWCIVKQKTGRSSKKPQIVWADMFESLIKNSPGIQKSYTGKLARKRYFYSFIPWILLEIKQAIAQVISNIHNDEKAPCQVKVHAVKEKNDKTIALKGKVIDSTLKKQNYFLIDKEMRALMFAKVNRDGEIDIVLNKKHSERLVKDCNVALSTKKSCDLKLFEVSGFVPLSRMIDVCKQKPDIYFEKEILNPAPAKQTKISSDEIFTHKFLNANQEKVVRKFIKRKSGIQLLLGPPGTGKTTTIVDCLYRLRLNKQRIVVAAYTNKAVQVILAKFLKVENYGKLPVVLVGDKEKCDTMLYGYLVSDWKDCFKNKLTSVIGLKEKIQTNKDSSKNQVFMEKIRQIRSFVERFVTIVNISSMSKYHASIKSGGLKHYTDDIEYLNDIIQELNGVDNETIKSNLLSKCPIVFTTVIRLGSAYIRKNIGHRDSLIIDEAANALEPATLVAISAKKFRKVLLVGDHHQLQPLVLLKNKKEVNFGWSMFFRLIVHCGVEHDMLTTQYRANPEIIQYSDNRYYQNNLCTHESVCSRKKPKQFLGCTVFNKQNVFIDCVGIEIMRERSFINEVEANTIVDVVKLLLDRFDVKPADIGIISFYKKQVEYIRQKLLSNNIKDILVHTADGFQGDEKEVILLSFVRANPIGNVGFLKNYCRLNVALTRARTRLMMFGNADTLLMQNHEVKVLLNILAKRKLLFSDDLLRKEINLIRKNETSFFYKVKNSKKVVEKVPNRTWFNAMLASFGKNDYQWVETRFKNNKILSRESLFVCKYLIDNFDDKVCYYGGIVSDHFYIEIKKRNPLVPTQDEDILSSLSYSLLMQIFKGAHSQGDAVFIVKYKLVKLTLNGKEIQVKSIEPYQNRYDYLAKNADSSYNAITYDPTHGECMSQAIEDRLDGKTLLSNCRARVMLFNNLDPDLDAIHKIFFEYPIRTFRYIRKALNYRLIIGANYQKAIDISLTNIYSRRSRECSDHSVCLNVYKIFCLGKGQEFLSMLLEEGKMYSKSTERLKNPEEYFVQLLLPTNIHNGVTKKFVYALTDINIFSKALAIIDNMNVLIKRIVPQTKYKKRNYNELLDTFKATLFFASVLYNDIKVNVVPVIENWTQFDISDIDEYIKERYMSIKGFLSFYPDYCPGGAAPWDSLIPLLTAITYSELSLPVNMNDETFNNNFTLMLHSIFANNVLGLEDVSGCIPRV